MYWYIVDIYLFVFMVIIYLFIFTYFFWERGREGERGGEKQQCVVAPHMPPTGDLANSPGMCPDWELNWWIFGFQAHAQSTELHNQGYGDFFFIGKTSIVYRKERSRTLGC